MTCPEHVLPLNLAQSLLSIALSSGADCALVGESFNRDGVFWSNNDGQKKLPQPRIFC